MTTITVESVTPRDGKRPWKIQSNGDEYVTWEDELGELLEKLEGQSVDVDVERRKNGRFVDFIITEVNAAAKRTATATKKAAPAQRDDEPHINTAKQIMIVRQNSWAQTQHIYLAALKFMDMAKLELTEDNVELVAKSLLPGMSRVAFSIEKTIRRNYFPMEDDPDSIPF